jgi:predicted chitinase
MKIKLSPETIAAITGSSVSVAKMYQDSINQALNQYGIIKPPQIAAFLSQIGTESGGLKYTTELASGKAYEGRKDLGNVKAGDGVKFKGRGFIQITGRANYQNLSNAFGVDFISNPELLATPKYAALSAAHYWVNRKRKFKGRDLSLNDIAQELDHTQPANSGVNYPIYEIITRGINGGVNGLKDRIERFNNGVKNRALLEADIKRSSAIEDAIAQANNEEPTEIQQPKIEIDKSGFVNVIDEEKKNSSWIWWTAGSILLVSGIVAGVLFIKRK